MRNKTTRNTIATSHTKSKHGNRCTTTTTTTRNNNISSMDLYSVEKKTKGIINTFTMQPTVLNTHTLY